MTRTWSMASRWVVVTGLAGWMGACNGGEPDRNGVPPADSAVADPGVQAVTPADSAVADPTDLAGQTGSPGQSECFEDDDCTLVAQRTVDAQSNESSATFRNPRCAQGACRITYITASGCSPSIYGPFYDCTLDDATLRERYTDDTTRGPGECQASGTAACAGSGLAIRFVPRDSAEWQGMLVQAVGPYCEQSAECSLALACVANMCTACTSDNDCSNGEACVLDHCLLPDLMGCRHAAECGSGQLCILSGYTGGIGRGNEEMRSYCQ